MTRSKETTVKLYQAKTVFDTPKYNPDGKYGPYYSMMIELPEGAPGTEYDQKYDRIFAYMSYDADDEAADALGALNRGEPLTVAWTGTKYKPALSDEAIESAPSRPAPGATRTGGSKAIEPTSPTLTRLGYTWLATQTADRILATYQVVGSDERASDLSPDERLRIAISGVIQANRDAPRDLAHAIDQAEREAITGVSADGLPGSLMNMIADLLPEKYDSPAEVVEALKELGLSSKDIDPDNPETWYELYAIAKSVSDDGVVDVPDVEDADDLFEDDDDLPPF